MIRLGFKPQSKIKTLTGKTKIQMLKTKTKTKAKAKSNMTQQ